MSTPDAERCVKDLANCYRAQEAIQDDIALILTALGRSVHSRPVSAHFVVRDEIIPAIESLMRRIPAPLCTNETPCRSCREWDAVAEAMSDLPDLQPAPSGPPETILQEAQRLVHGDRGANYGHPIDDYKRTGRIWGAILGLPDIDPRICCLMMVAVKVSRETNKHKRDNLTDLAGYAECASMVAERQELK